jgi:hypothetical protein
MGWSMDSVTKEGHFVINLLEDPNFVPLIDEDEVGMKFKFTLHLSRTKVELRAEGIETFHYSPTLALFLPNFVLLYSFTASINA